MRPFPEPIYVTRPLLPPVEEVTARLRDIWGTGWLTNGGDQHARLELSLRAQLDVPHLSLFNNGTTALLAAIRALGLSQSVLTTPFTFPATPHALTWSGVTPVFCDIDPVTMNIDPARIEERITPDVTGILAVHLYGVPCDVKKLEEIARERDLPLIFDAAQAFGARIDDVGIGNFGDVSMFSFHATKIFHTAEGGALACGNEETRRQVDLLRNFGILNQEEVDVPGINGKLSELQAALGLTVLDLWSEESARRRALMDRYRRQLRGTPGLSVMQDLPGVDHADSYCVVRIRADEFGCSRDAVQAELETHNVYARKYFYPLCSTYECYRHLESASPANLPVAEAVSREVLCLPLYGQLELSVVDQICELVCRLPSTSAPRSTSAV